jgi:hypothetical protein
MNTDSEPSWLFRTRPFYFRFLVARIRSTCQRIDRRIRRSLPAQRPVTEYIRTFRGGSRRIDLAGAHTECSRRVLA